MFFRRKKKEKQGDDYFKSLRSLYRQVPSKNRALSVQLKLTADGEPIHGELKDVNAGGAGVQFPADRDPGLELDQKVDLTFSSLKSEGTVVLSARVAGTEAAEEGGSRYGFEFLEVGGLFENLDSYLFPLFNRRRVLREMGEAMD